MTPNPPSQGDVLRRLERAVEELHDVVAEFQAVINESEGADDGDR